MKTAHNQLVAKSKDIQYGSQKNATAFYPMAYLGEPAQAVEMCVGAEYIQHNPLVGDGERAFIEYFGKMVKDYPDQGMEFVTAVAEGNLVALYTHQTWPENEEYVTMDFFRFDQHGKIVEHSDAIQQVPGETKNNNPMY
jgi:predicted SnoaL-like aldol condensation-catalyzing enzyme